MVKYDFVVLIPTGGVICLEIKGGRVSCNHGVWQTIDRFGAVANLKQESLHAGARRNVCASARNPRENSDKEVMRAAVYSGTQWYSPTWIPPPQTPEFEVWEAIGRNDLKTPISKNIQKVLSAQRKKLGWSRHLPPRKAQSRHPSISSPRFRASHRPAHSSQRV